MQFHEILTRERKVHGLSQEELAQRLSVSRQAVSKWETGDSAPDLNNLLALADTLELSLDTLCGRESPTPLTELTPAPADSPKKAGKALPLVCFFLAVLVVIIGICFWDTEEKAPPESPLMMLTEPFTVSGVNFSGLTDRNVEFRFTPSISGEGFTYTISFTGSNGVVKTFDAPYSGGVCVGIAGFGEKYGGYTVSVSVSDGITSRNLAIAEDMNWSKSGSSWSPLVD